MELDIYLLFFFVYAKTKTQISASSVNVQSGLRRTQSNVP